MSEKRRVRRQDADANLGRILATAAELLGAGAEPSMGQIAAAAGLSRQTLYAHFASRESLYAAVADMLVEEATVLNLIDDPDPVAGLARWLTEAWGLIERYPALLSPALTTTETDLEAHEPVLGGLRDLLRRARRSRRLRPGVSDEWLVAAIIALGHAAGQEAAARRMTIDEAGRAFRDGVLNLAVAADPGLPHGASSR